MRVLVMIACLLPVSAMAGDDLARAVKYFKRLEYRKAVKVAARVLEQPSADHKALVSAYRMQGLCFAALGKTKESVAAFSRLLAIEPSFRLSKMVSPKLSPPFYQALGLASDRKPISLSHEQPKKVNRFGGLRLPVRLEANPFQMVAAVRLRYRVTGGREKKLEKTVKGTGLVVFSLPEKLSGSRMKYYFEALNRYGGVLVVADRRGKAFELKTAPKPPVKDVSIVAASHPAVEALPPAPPGNDRPATTVSDRTPWYNSWWFWTAVGVVVAGAATGTAVALTAGGSGGGPYHYGIEIK